MKNTFNLSQKSYVSQYLHCLTPFFWKNIVPGDSFKFTNRYEIDCIPAVGQVLSDFSAHFMHVFVPYSQIWTNFGKYWNGAAGIETPHRVYNLANVTDARTLSYTVLPPSTAENNTDIMMLLHRAYQKTVFDLFLSKLFQAGTSVDIDPADYYSTGDGADSTTLDTLGYVPFTSDYYNECVANIRLQAATSITSPFTIDDLKSALVTDNLRAMQAKFGVRINDLIDKIFHINRKPKDSVEVVNYYSSKLVTNDVVNTANSQGNIISKTYGVTPKVNFTGNFEEYGILLGLCWVSCDDITYSLGVPQNLVANNYGTSFGFFHPEVQGLAFDNIVRNNINVNSTTPSTAIGYTEIYNDMRKSFNFAGGEFSRTTRKNLIPHYDNGVTDIVDVIYPDETSFLYLFNTNVHQYSLYADMNIQATRPIARVMSDSNIIRDVDNILVL